MTFQASPCNARTYVIAHVERPVTEVVENTLHYSSDTKLVHVVHGHCKDALQVDDCQPSPIALMIQ